MNTIKIIIIRRTLRKIMKTEGNIIKQRSRIRRKNIIIRRRRRRRIIIRRIRRHRIIIKIINKNKKH